MSHDPARLARLREAQQRIDWIVSQPGFSDWLKLALRSAVERDPVAVINDLEILTHVLRAWSAASMHADSSPRQPISGDGAR